MSLLDDDDAPQKKAVGGLGMLGALKGKVERPSVRNDESAWKKVWAARGGFNFSVKKGEEAEIVFLDDISIFVAASLLTGWVSDGQNFPKFDYVRSPGYDDEGNPVAGGCPISAVTGSGPVLIGVAPILDMRSFTDKEGVVHKCSFRPLLIKSDSVLTQLQTISKHHGKPLKWARMHVSRSMDPKSPGTGDTWFCEGFVDPNTLSKKIPNFATELAKLDMKAGFPRPTPDMIKSMLGLHVHVAEKNKDKGSKVTIYNKDAWDAMNGRVSVAVKEQFFDLKDITDQSPKGLVHETKSGFNLDDLEDALGG